MKSKLRTWCWAALAGVALGACWRASQQGKVIWGGERVADAYGDVIELDQGWTDDIQQAFYNTPQGSDIIPYAWALVLEQKDSDKAFLDPANIERFRYLPRKKTPSNPDGMPVGWTKGQDASGKEWLGMACASCHTGQIEYTNPKTRQKMAIRVDGAPTLADFNSMNVELVAALMATLDDQAKFDRFAKGVLKGTDSSDARNALRGELASQTVVLNTRNEINKAPVEYGFGRIDAIGFIFNQTMSVLPGIPENAKPSDAPASYPFLWGTDQSDVVQWTGFAANLRGPGALVRNGGEVIGVYGHIKLTTGDTYDSSLLIDNLAKYEEWVRELVPPAWPASVFPPIDQTKAALGKALFESSCAQCHRVIPRDKAITTTYVAPITPIDAIGTDPTELSNMSDRMYQAGIYNGKKAYVLVGPVIGGTQNQDRTTGLNPLINAVLGALLRHPGETAKSAFEELNLRGRSACQSPAGYKARPLNGIWATAPYLHNGSVPNLYELLLPAAQRSKTFPLGSREYDPVRVGYSMEQPKAADGYTPFIFDARHKGNGNAGHEYVATLDGVPFTEEQRWQLVEYMKTL